VPGIEYKINIRKGGNFTIHSFKMQMSRKQMKMG
jgi:hypothetical protein